MMGTDYAFLVDCPRYFHDEKKVLLGSSLQAVLKWLEDDMKRAGMSGSRIDSIVCVGEVLNG